MRTSALVIFALMAIFLSPGPAMSQGFEIGPGGVRVYGQCEELRRSCERGEGGCPDIGKPVEGPLGGFVRRIESRLPE